LDLIEFNTDPVQGIDHSFIDGDSDDILGIVLDVDAVVHDGCLLVVKPPVMVLGLIPPALTRQVTI
jgi:hypothetical protein